MYELQTFFSAQGEMLNSLNKHVRQSFTESEIKEMVDEKLMNEARQSEIDEAIRTGEIDPSELE